MEPCSTTLRDDNTVCKRVFAGHELWLDASKTLYWPRHEMLIVADLHFEKGSYFAQKGSALPCYDTFDTLMRLEAVIARYQPKQVVCLGDSFHDAHAFDRLKAQNKTLLDTLTQGVAQWHWIVGNHDPEIPEQIAGFKHAEMEIDGILLTHEPSSAATPQIVGHYHPKLQVTLGGIKAKGAGFIHDDALMIMPSFGSYTGGLDVDDPAIRQLFRRKTQSYLVYRDKIWNVRT